MTVSAEVLTARPTCQAARAALDAYVRGGLPNREAHRVSAHLECCRSCTAVYLQLVEGAEIHVVRRLLPARPGTAFLGVALSAVLGGLLIVGLRPFGGAEDRAPDPPPVGALPVATAPGSVTGDASAKPSRKPRPSPQPDSPPNPDAPASTSAFAPPGAQPVQTPHAHSSDVAASTSHGHGGHGGGQQTPPPAGVVTISSDELAPALPLPPVTMTIPSTPGLGLVIVP